MKLVVGVAIGLVLSAAFAPLDAQRNDGKTESCIEDAPWLMSKKYLCTPAEAEARRKAG